MGTIIGTMLRIYSSGEPITEVERLEADAKIAEIQVELKEFQDKVEQENAVLPFLPNDYKKPLIEFMMHTRSLLSALIEGSQNFLYQRKLVHLQLQKMLALLGDSSEELKTQLGELLDSLQKIDVQKIGSPEVPRNLN